MLSGANKENILEVFAKGVDASDPAWDDAVKAGFSHAKNKEIYLNKHNQLYTRAVFLLETGLYAGNPLPAIRKMWDMPLEITDPDPLFDYRWEMKWNLLHMLDIVSSPHDYTSKNGIIIISAVKDEYLDKAVRAILHDSKNLEEARKLIFAEFEKYKKPVKPPEDKTKPQAANAGASKILPGMEWLAERSGWTASDIKTALESRNIKFEISEAWKRFLFGGERQNAEDFVYLITRNANAAEHYRYTLSLLDGLGKKVRKEYIMELFTKGISMRTEVWSDIYTKFVKSAFDRSKLVMSKEAAKFFFVIECGAYEEKSLPDLFKNEWTKLKSSSDSKTIKELKKHFLNILPKLKDRDIAELLRKIIQ